MTVPLYVEILRIKENVGKCMRNGRKQQIAKPALKYSWETLGVWEKNQMTYLRFLLGITKANRLT